MALFPPRNLPTDAIPWGRDVETRITAQERTQTSITQRIGNVIRAFTGQLTVVSRQLNELTDRSLYTTGFANFSVTGSATTETFPRGNRNVSIPGAGSARGAIVAVSFELNESPNLGGNSSIFTEIYLDGSLIGRARTDSRGSGILGWPQGVVNVTVPATIPSSGASLQIRIIRVGSTSASSTWTASSGSVSVYYGSKV